MFDLFGRKRIRELEKENSSLSLDLEREQVARDEWEALSDRTFERTRNLTVALKVIHAETFQGKSGTAQKIARMAREALENCP